MELKKNSIECRFCGSTAKVEFQTRILNLYDVSYFRCENCQLIQSEQPFWLQEAYEKAISVLDTGIFLRNNDNAKKLTVLLTEIQNQITKTESILSSFKRLLFKNKPFQGKILDFGGGHGILVRMMRDIGFDCYWYDKYAKNDFATGFESNKNDTYDVVLAFELFEHFENPKENIEEILKLSEPKVLIFSTLLYGDRTPAKDWWYYAFEAGQHIAFYNSKTIESMKLQDRYTTFSVLQDLHLLVRNDVKLNRNRLIRSLRKLERNFFKAKNLYSSKTFVDHSFLKNTIHSVSE